MKVCGKTSRRSRASVVLPLDEAPLIPTVIALRRVPAVIAGEISKIEGGLSVAYDWNTAGYEVP